MKKILSVFIVFLLFICNSFASEQEKFFKYLQCHFSDFISYQFKNYKDALNLSETEHDEEFAFRKLYTDYMEYYKETIQYYSENVKTPFNSEYVKKYNKEYLKYGVGFNLVEGNWDVEEDYSMLLETPEIPKVWIEWLKLQEKYVKKHRKTCIKRGGCEGTTMTIPEIEQAIIDLEKIEQKSEAIASIQSHKYDYIPYTSRELMDTYLMGNDLKPIFDWNEDDSQILNKKSKKSFEHFIKHHKNSKYWGIVNNYYNRLKQNNFIYSPYINGWLIDELTNLK